MTTINYSETGLTLTLTLPDDDRAILNAIISIQRDAAKYLFDAADHDLTSEIRQNGLTQFDYNGDHVDYNPAAAYVLSKITDELCSDGHLGTDDFHPDTLFLLDGQGQSDLGYDKTFYRSPRTMIAYLISDDDFIQSLDTWGGYTTDIFRIDYTDDLN